MRRTLVTTLIAAAACVALASCGSSSKGGPVTLQFWAYNEPSGAFRAAAKTCSEQSHGKYTIAFNPLANDADTQRQQLVRRLAAKDSSIDIMSMDVVWTSEFAGAGWIKPFPAAMQREVKANTLAGPYATGTYQGRLYAVPANSNTQLLWYRKDLVKKPPQTWDELITAASKLKTAGRIEIQGAAYEGMTVWFNALVDSAGGSILRNPTTSAIDQTAETAANIIARLGTSKAADPSLSSQKEDQNRQAFETGQAAFEVNYPFIYPSAKMNAPKLFKQIGWAPYPRVSAGKPLRAPIGGFNWGVGAYGKHQPQAFAAALCLRSEQNQRQAAKLGGLPPTIAKVYDEPAFKKSYPFADLIRRQIQSAGVRPKTPAYADLSLALATTLSPPGRIKGPAALSKLKSSVDDALKSRGLF